LPQPADKPATGSPAGPAAADANRLEDDPTVVAHQRLRSEHVDQLVEAAVMAAMLGGIPGRHAPRDRRAPGFLERRVGCIAVKVRHEEPGDADAVAEVHREAFGNHGDVVATLVDDLRTRLSDELGLSLVAESRGVVVGHAMFSRGLVDAPTRLVAVEILGPVGVRPHAQRNGVATALIRRGLELVGARQVPAVFLEGDPGFYGRFGFIPAGTRGFRKPSLRIPDAAFQVLMLPSYEPWMTGTLVYPEPFWLRDSVGLRDSAA
jgi:putative acetyltransferase